jgi:hypothetical protein
MAKFNITEKPASAPEGGIVSQQGKRFSYYPILDAVDESGKAVKIKGQEQEFSENMVMQQITMVNSELQQLAARKTFLDGEAVRLAEILVEIKKAG